MTALAKLPPLPDTELLTTLGRDAYTDQQMRDYARAAIAALSPAELGGVALTTSFVQEVPDKCDRIVWRGHYYHLPVNSESTPRAAEAVTEEMVERAAIAIHEHRRQQSFLRAWERYFSDYQNELRDEARAAITAALTPPSAKGE